ncbi:MAG: cyclic nucleotide-binding domain-containing protein [Acidobacteria bacterium]|nr:cyclic nucleotide-binding domain-containing protein [Acidobacteriota bacterium]MBS1865426.1 cyclic nucleotide-binding domain-containing protein [Acidobacteriota bacterium]
MADTEKATQIEHIISEVKKFSVFADLSEEDLHWLAERMDEVTLAQGELYAKQGDSVDYLTLMMEGEVQFSQLNAPGSPVFVVVAGEIAGRLPFSRLKTFKGTARAVMPTRAIRLHRQYFPELVQRMPLLTERLVALMSDRIREMTRFETQQEKLMALGKLSAGLAHELNNPAAAASRAAQSLMGAFQEIRDVSLRLLKHASTEEQRAGLFDFEMKAGKSYAAEMGKTPDPLELSDREERVADWLEKHDIPDSWKIAATLAEGCVDEPQLEKFVGIVGPEILSDAIRRVAVIINMFGLIQEIENSTKRISDLVGAVKRYSYMDQMALQEVDIREDIDNTLKIFGHRLKAGVTIVRDYDPALPKVTAYGGELNQVWTNIIDNAIDAMKGKGELRIKTCKELDYARVEIEDTGSGIPKEIQSRIFDPFFTTKRIGEGTGLGLDAVGRIVRRHHGIIEVESEPGKTCFSIRLPFKQPSSQPEESEEVPA